MMLLLLLLPPVECLKQQVREHGDLPASFVWLQVHHQVQARRSFQIPIASVTTKRLSTARKLHQPWQPSQEWNKLHTAKWCKMWLQFAFPILEGLSCRQSSRVFLQICSQGLENEPVRASLRACAFRSNCIDRSMTATGRAVNSYVTI